MVRRSCLPLVLVLTLAAAAPAMAAPRARPHTVYFYHLFEHFGITLDTKAAGVLTAGTVPETGSFPLSSVLVVCPKDANGATPELQLGFPGARLKLSGGRYRLKITYTWRRPRLNVFTGPAAGTFTTPAPATVSISAEVLSPKLISGTVSVREAGCELPRSSFRATIFRSVAN